MLALPPLAAEPIFFGNISITNTYINSTLTVIGFIIVAYLIKQAADRLTKDSAPRGILNFFEALLEFFLGYLDKVTHDRVKSIKFLPIVGSLFFFIVVSNWIGLFPGIGSIGQWQVHHGNLELIPLFRPANTDINMTLSMAILAVVASHIFGIIAIGIFKYFNKFVKLGDLYHAFRSGNPTKILVAIIEFFVGFLEIISEVAKMVSLSLRLFGNVFAGEVLLTVMAGLIAVFVPLPFMALELLVGVVQATVFAMLTLVYLTIATTPVHAHNSNDKKEHLEPTPTV